MYSSPVADRSVVVSVILIGKADKPPDIDSTNRMNLDDSKTPFLLTLNPTVSTMFERIMQYHSYIATNAFVH